MRLSMWILYDWLKKYDPEPRITRGDQILRSARTLSQDITIERQNVYLARASEFINGEDRKIICVHDTDLILLHTDDMNEVLNRIFDAFDFYNSWSDSLRDQIAAGCTIQEIVDQSHEVFRQPLLVFDSGNEMIGYSSMYPKGSLDPEWDSILEHGTNSLNFLLKINKLLKEQKSYHDIHHFALEGTPYTSEYRSLFLNRSWIGRLVLLETTHVLTTGEKQLFNSFAEMIELWAEHNEKTYQLREETAIFRELLEGKRISPEEIDHKMQMMGWNREDIKYLVRIEIPQNREEIARSVFVRLEHTFTDSLVIYTQEVLYLLVNERLDPQDTFRGTLCRILAMSELCAVISYGFYDVYLLQDYNEQTSVTYHYIGKEPGVLYDCRDHALDCIHAFIHSAVPGVLKHPAVNALKEYDRNSESELYSTLYVYLRNNCNMAETARKLHLHRNSLLYRLNQIRSLTGISFEQEDLREYLLLSYYMESENG